MPSIVIIHPRSARKWKYITAKGKRLKALNRVRKLVKRELNILYRERGMLENSKKYRRVQSNPRKILFHRRVAPGRMNRSIVQISPRATRTPHPGKAQLWLHCAPATTMIIVGYRLPGKLNTRSQDRVPFADETRTPSGQLVLDRPVRSTASRHAFTSFRADNQRSSGSRPGHRAMRLTCRLLRCLLVVKSFSILKGSTGSLCPFAKITMANGEASFSTNPPIGSERFGMGDLFERFILHVLRLIASVFLRH